MQDCKTLFSFFCACCCVCMPACRELRYWIVGSINFARDRSGLPREFQNVWNGEFKSRIHISLQNTSDPQKLLNSRWKHNQGLFIFIIRTSLYGCWSSFFWYQFSLFGRCNILGRYNFFFLFFCGRCNTSLATESASLATAISQDCSSVVFSRIVSL